MHAGIRVARGAKQGFSHLFVLIQQNMHPLITTKK